MNDFHGTRARAIAIALLPATVLATATLSRAADGDTTTASMHASKRHVVYGHRLRLNGEFPGTAHQPIAIQMKKAGSSNWRTVAHDRTGASGRFHKRVHPHTTGKWRAQIPKPKQSADDPAATDPLSAPVSYDRQTNAEGVRVRSLTKTRLASHNTTVGHRVAIKGRVFPGGQKRRVAIHVGKHTLHTSTGHDGRFKRRWSAGSTGSYHVGARADGNRSAGGSRDGAGKLDVFRPAAASWYGPGFYGQRTACGQTLSSGMLGVANKTMPCGTKLTLRYQGHEVNVRVIDRGPYSGNREFDLTEATKNRLHFGSTGTVLSSR